MTWKKILYDLKEDPIWLERRSYMTWKKILYDLKEDPIWVERIPKRIESIKVSVPEWEDLPVSYIPFYLDEIGMLVIDCRGQR